MDRTNDTNIIIQDSSCKERSSKLKKQTEQQEATISEKMDSKFEDFMKLFRDITSEHKYLEKREAQGSSKKARNSIECPKDNNFEFLFFFFFF